MSKKERDIRFDKITDLIDAINAVYEIRCDGSELQKSVYLDYRNGKYYIYKATENSNHFISRAVYESYNINEIKVYLMGFVDAL